MGTTTDVSPESCWALRYPERPCRTPVVLPPRTWAGSESQLSAGANHAWYKTVTSLFSCLVSASHQFFSQRKFLTALMPITCNSVSSPMGLGSDSQPVHVQLYGRETYLADSMQFQLEYLLRQGHRGAWYVMPTFRGEDPDKRHLNQFFHVEAEIQGGFATVLDLVEAYVRYCAKAVIDELSADMAQITGLAHIEALIRRKGRFARITHQQACARLKGQEGYLKRITPLDTLDLTPAGERELARQFGGCVWLTHPPAKNVPFYQATTEDGQKAKSADLLLGAGEVVGCGERHSQHTKLMSSLAEHEVAAKPYAWYLDMKKSFPMQTSGFGMGLERFLLWLLNHDDVRDMHVFSRLKGKHCDP